MVNLSNTNFSLFCIIAKFFVTLLYCFIFVKSLGPKRTLNTNSFAHAVDLQLSLYFVIHKECSPFNLTGIISQFRNNNTLFTIANLAVCF